MKNRRSFIRNITVTALSAAYLPADIFASTTHSSDKPELAKGSVILFQGDSITDGNRGRDADPNHIMGHGYAFAIASRLGADYPHKKYTFYNRGISGNKITDLEKRWKNDTLDLKPELISILIGVNDSSSVVLNWQPIISVEMFEESYNSLLEITQKQFPNIIPVVCEPFILKSGKVSDYWKLYHDDLTKRQNIIRKLASKYNAVFVGFQEIFNKACEKAEPAYWIWDGVHPTVAGHELMAREWLRKVGERIQF